MLNIRSCGILLHPTSLPGRFGSGDFGREAYRFVDWLKSAAQRYWQVLPLGEIGPGNSPYMSTSAFAGNVLLIDLEEFVERGWLIAEDLVAPHVVSELRVDFEQVRSFRMHCLRLAYRNFLIKNNESQAEFKEFCQKTVWLHDYALFMAISERQGGKEWRYWPDTLRKRESQAIAEIVQEQIEEIDFWKFCQWCYQRQWFRLKEYANSQGIHIIGDVPIFVAYQSADVWAHQELFLLDEAGNPTVVAGVPPDYFSTTGQLWGNPLYDWDEHERTGYAWWLDRMRHALHFADAVRIDHFRGFAGYWEIPADAPNAVSGKWVTGPGNKLFDAMQRVFPKLPVIAEDLGIITPDVAELRDKYALPGMRVLQFAFGDNESNPFLPHNYVENTVAYTGTHDNDTTLGWWQSLSEHEKSFALRHLEQFDGKPINWMMMHALLHSVASTVIFPLQDVLDLDSKHRMNFPGHPTGNWEWRFTWEQVTQENSRRLQELVISCGRLAYR